MEKLDLRVEYVPIGTVKEYENNAKRHPDEQIAQIMESIRQFGNCDPIGVWHDQEKDADVIVEGHGRLMALMEMGETEVPIIRLDHLTDEQRRAYGLVHNKLTMNSDFEDDMLEDELDDILDIDMSTFGFDKDDGEDWFANRTRYDNGGAYNDEYNEFTEKFKPKRTTDDCYTPDGVYEAVAEWVADEYGVKRVDMKRPFYPGGDYKKEEYKDEDVVVDNPPFSILAQIIQFYTDNEIRFFLFAPALTLFSSSSSSTAIATGVQITYENGANVNTSFVTNLDDEGIRVRTAPGLYRRVKDADEKIKKDNEKELPKYIYPDQVITAAMCSRFSKYGVDFSITRDETYRIGALDEQKEQGVNIFGSGYLLSEKAAVKKIEAEKAAAEKAAAEKAAAEKAAAREWRLSERERDIVRSLGNAT